MDERVQSELEFDGPSSFADPFSGIFWLNRLKSYLLLLALLVILLQSFWLYRLGAGTSAHVYELHPDGAVRYVAEREAHLAPRWYEARHVAREFVDRLYGWNSSTVSVDLAAAINMANDATGEQLRGEFADAQFINRVRERVIRSEIQWQKVEVLEQGKRAFRARLWCIIERFGLLQYEGAPLERLEVGVEVILGVVPRSPDWRPNGLEVVGMFAIDPYESGLSEN